MNQEFIDGDPVGQMIHQPRPVRQTEIMAYGGGTQIGIHQEHRLVQLLGNANGQIDGRQRLSFSRQGAGNHQSIVTFFGSPLQDVGPQHLIPFGHGSFCFSSPDDETVVGANSQGPPAPCG